MKFQIPCTEIISSNQKKNISQSKTWTAITLTDSIWKDNGTITITFGEFGCEGCSPDAAWSQIGKHSNDNNPSMNLGFIDPPYESFTLNGVKYTPDANATRNYCGTTGKSSCTQGWHEGATVIHEFGHALGMLHEHQNNLENSNSIKLNRDAVIGYYNKIGMGESGAVTNVLEMYNCTPGVDCDYSGTKFDPKSIMLYALPNDWVIGTNPTSPNFVLSSEDIGWLQHQYPRESTDYPEITVKFIDQNPVPWKVAWVQKVITETYGPLIGVKWVFDTQNILGNGSPTSDPIKSPNTTTTLGFPIDDKGKVVGTSLRPNELLVIIMVFVVFLLPIFCILCFKLLAYFIERRKQ